MKLNTPFTILNRKLNEMDFIRNAMKLKEQSATERLHNDYRKMFKSDPCIIYCEKKIQLLVMDMCNLLFLNSLVINTSVLFLKPTFRFNKNRGIIKA